MASAIFGTLPPALPPKLTPDEEHRFIAELVHGIPGGEYVRSAAGKKKEATYKPRKPASALSTNPATKHFNASTSRSFAASYYLFRVLTYSQKLLR